MSGDSSKSEVVQTTAPQTIAECLADLEPYRNALFKAHRDSGQEMTRELANKFHAQTVERAASHASNFAVSEVAGADLLALAQLYTAANQPEQAEAAIAARIADEHSNGRGTRRSAVGCARPGAAEPHLPRGCRGRKESLRSWTQSGLPCKRSLRIADSRKRATL